MGFFSQGSGSDDATPPRQGAGDAAAGQQDETAWEREQAQSLTRIEQGGIPLAAERRLSELREHGGLFTSDLSVAEFALGHRLGLRPLSQVMGSCVHQVGWQYASSAAYSYAGAVAEELEVISEAWNEARRKAISRMAQEAQHAGADAVVGVRLHRGEHDWAAGAVDYVVVGTAVREAEPQRSQTPVLTDLSLQDYYKLKQGGAEPCGFVAATACFFIVRSQWSTQMQMLTFSSNQEITDYTQGLYAARMAGLSRLTSQAAEAGASGIVGMSIAHAIGEQELKMSPMSGALRGLVVTFHMAGTAIRETGQRDDFAPECTIDLTT